MNKNVIRKQMQVLWQQIQQLDITTNYNAKKEKYVQLTKQYHDLCEQFYN